MLNYKLYMKQDFYKLSHYNKLLKGGTPCLNPSENDYVNDPSRSEKNIT